MFFAAQLELGVHFGMFPRLVKDSKSSLRMFLTARWSLWFELGVHFGMSPKLVIGANMNKARNIVKPLILLIGILLLHEVQLK